MFLRSARGDTGYIFRSLEQDLLRAVAGKFRKSHKLKMLGKTAGDSPHGEGKSRTFSANSVTKYSGSLVYSLLIIFHSLLIIIYSLLIIVHPY